MSSRRTLNEINWEEPWNPLYGSPIEIPPFTVLWRGYDLAYSPISDHPSYYSSHTVANGYAALSGRKIGAFYSTRPLRVLDVRHMKHIVTHMIQMNKSDPFVRDWFCPILSFGLCSLRHQIILYQNMYKLQIQNKDKQVLESLDAMISMLDPTSIVEPAGIRIGETTLDGRTMQILKELFLHEFDGFISPRTPSAFHVEKNGTLSPELILFSPIHCQLYQLNDQDAFTSKRNIITISSLLTHRHEVVHLSFAHGKETAKSTFYMKGGQDIRSLIPTQTHPLDEYDYLRNLGRTKRMDRYAKQAGKRLRSMIQINRNERPVFTAPPEILDHIPNRLDLNL